jgi:hypothetical protein
MSTKPAHVMRAAVFAGDVLPRVLADPSSMKAARTLAVLMAGHRRAGETARPT